MYRFASLNDARQRLDGTVITVNGEPYFIEHMMSKTEFDGVHLLTRDSQRVRLGEQPEKLRLGYVNYRGAAVFVSRRPVRRVRQGLCSDNITLTGAPVDTRALLPSEAFGKMLKNDYPSVKDVVASLKQRGDNSIAFSRLFALKATDTAGKYRLLYCGNSVGVYREGEGFILDDAFQCLKEVLNVST